MALLSSRAVAVRVPAVRAALAEVLLVLLVLVGPLEVRLATRRSLSLAVAVLVAVAVAAAVAEAAEVVGAVAGAEVLAALHMGRRPSARCSEP